MHGELELPTTSRSADAVDAVDSVTISEVAARRLQIHLRPVGARKTFDAAVDRWTAFGSAVLDPIETSSTLGRLLFATGQTGVLTADRTAIATGAKLKTD